MEIECRSPEQIEAEAICTAHDQVCAGLNAVTNGGCLLYVGDRRRRMVALRNELEACIMGAPWRHSWTPARAVYAVMCL